MSKNFSVEIITPTSHINIESVDYLRLPGVNGLFGVMRDHAPVLVSLGVGEIKVENQGETEYMATSGGFLDFKDNKAQLLLESVEKSSEIDVTRAEKSQDRAKNRLKDGKLDRVRTELSLSRALNRLKVGKRI